jgi:thiazolylpeptide-type bacteriocin precursor
VRPTTTTTTVASLPTPALTDDDFARFDVEELAVFDVTTAVALPVLGASKMRFTCCSSSSSSSCCST